MAIEARTSCGVGHEVVAHHARANRRPGASSVASMRIKRRLAGAVRPEDREDHAARHVEVDAVDGPEIAEAP